MKVATENVDSGHDKRVSLIFGILRFEIRQTEPFESKINIQIYFLRFKITIRFKFEAYTLDFPNSLT